MNLFPWLYSKSLLFIFFSANPILLIYLGNHTFVFYGYEPVSVLGIGSSVFDNIYL